MDFPEKFERVMGGKRYRCSTATVTADDQYWDGHNWERRGTNTFLAKTPNGGFFLLHRSQWQGAEDPSIEPLTREEAIEWWDMLREKRVTYEQAFGIAPVEA